MEDLACNPADSVLDSNDAQFKAVMTEDCGDKLRENGSDAVGHTYADLTLDNDDDSDSQSENEKEGQGLPWHHVQLYRLYGDEADYFLYPKLVIEKHSGAKPLARRLIGSSKQGQIGAKVLWTKLRDDSSRKLENLDASFPSELKSSYQAFVREFIRSNDKDENHCMYTSKDVPDIEKLMDCSRQRRIKERQHRTQVMWRASRKNEDSATILMYNNPLPDLNNRTGEETILRYLPSIESASSSLVKNEDSRNRQAVCSISLPGPTKDRSSICYATPKLDHQCSSGVNSDEAMAPYKCIFLTEADTDTPGQYSQKKKTTEKSKDLATHFKHDTSKNTSLYPQSLERAVTQVKPVHQCPSAKRSTPPAQPQVPEPLTLAALLEYKIPVTAQSHSANSVHLPRMWPVM